jgi:hypothetical protein
VNLNQLLRCRTRRPARRVLGSLKEALWNLGFPNHVTASMIGHSCLRYGAAMI